MERDAHQRVVGNIYKGRVENVLPGMQAAFVNIGLDRNAYLYVADAYPVPEEDEEEPEVRQLVRRRRSIGELLRPGQEVIVQVAKEPVGTKGARVTRTITLPGRYLVLVPGGSHVAVSQRLTDERERERLRALAREIRPRGAGLIVRTAAEGRSAEDLEADVAALRRLWTRIRQRARRTPAPALLHSDQDVVYRVLRDALSPDVVAIRTDAPREHARALELVRLFAPELEGRLSLEAPGSPPLFEARGVDWTPIPFHVGSSLRLDLHAAPLEGQIVLRTIERSPMPAETGKRDEYDRRSRRATRSPPTSTATTGPTRRSTPGSAAAGFGPRGSAPRTAPRGARGPVDHRGATRR